MSRPFSALTNASQWLASRLTRATVDVAAGVVELEWKAAVSSGPPAHAPRGALALDRGLILLRALPERGQVVRVGWAPFAPPQTETVLLGIDEGEWPADVFMPVGLAVDAGQRLFVSCAATQQILVVDLERPELLRRVPVGAAPGGLCAHGNEVYAATSVGVLRLDAIEEPRQIGSGAACDAVAMLSGRLLVLVGARTASATLRWADANDPLATVPWATDLAAAGEVLVVATQGGTTLRRFALGGAGLVELPYLDAPAFDGRAIVAGPAGRIAYFTSAGGIYLATNARWTYERSGLVTTYALDAGAYQAQWGRLFVDACVPPGTRLRVSCVAADDLPVASDAAPWTGPSNLGAIGPPPAARAQIPASAAPTDTTPMSPLYRRDRAEAPWSRATAPADFHTYEAPIDADPGRYLWVTLELTGNGGATPKVRALRAERSSHALVRRLPKYFSRDAAAASFLQRYLALFDGLLDDLESRSLTRHALLAPDAAPAEALPFLASLLGLALDGRLEPAQQRALIREAAGMFRRRGTVGSIARLVEVVVGVAPFILEWQVPTDGLPAQERPELLSAPLPAHSYRIIVPAPIGDDTRTLLTSLLNVHGPAHTSFEIVSAPPGTLVGGDTYVGLTTFVSISGAPAAYGGAVFDSGDTIGRPRAPLRPRGRLLGSSGLGP